MKYMDEYRDRGLIGAVAAEIKKISRKEIALMEVCGGHTMAIHRFGLTSLLPTNIRLLSGPGCPVCVSGQSYIDEAIEYSRIPSVILTTYGDLIRVPGSGSSLEKEKAKGQDIRIVYSVLDAVETAIDNPDKTVIFLGIGFETTAPATAAAVLRAKRLKVNNFLVHSAHKVMPPVMKALVEDGVKLDGFIAPGHVSAITGSGIYTDLAEKYGLGVVIAGFEPFDIMQSILMLVKQIEENHPTVGIQYKRVVQKGGNEIARGMMNDVFEIADDTWRGLGMIPLSGLKLNDSNRQFDPAVHLEIKIPESAEPKGCICGEILRGKKIPGDCALFGKACTPSNPVGACMVASEGSCAAYFKYNR